MVEMYATALRKLLPILKPHICKHKEADVIERALELAKATNQIRKKTGTSGQMYPIEVLKEFDDLRQTLVSLHGRQAVNLSKIRAVDYAIMR